MVSIPEKDILQRRVEERDSTLSEEGRLCMMKVLVYNNEEDKEAEILELRKDRTEWKEMTMNFFSHVSRMYKKYNALVDICEKAKIPLPKNLQRRKRK